MMKKQQLEMSLGGAASCRPASFSRSRRARAQWWFQQMRLVVDRAEDWTVSSPPTAPVLVSGSERRR